MRDLVDAVGTRIREHNGYIFARFKLNRRNLKFISIITHFTHN